MTGPGGERTPAHGVDPAVQSFVSERGITELLHFTTRRGLVGILAQGRLQARAHLETDDYLEHVYRPNSNYRRERSEFWRYVNLSITQVNGRFFSISRGWHANEADLFWAVLSFAPVAMAHEGVLFSTSNMAYEGVEPAPGVEGLRALFADPAHDGFGRYMRRPSGKPGNEATASQAEVLYPDAVSTDLLQRIYVADDMAAASVEAIVGSVGHDDVEVLVQPGLFAR